MEQKFRCPWSCWSWEKHRGLVKFGAFFINPADGPKFYRWHSSENIHPWRYERILKLYRIWLLIPKSYFMSEWNQYLLISERESGQICSLVRRRRIRGNEILSWKWKKKNANPTHWWSAHVSVHTEIAPKRCKRLPLWSLAGTPYPERPSGGSVKCLSCEIHHQNSWRHMTTSGTVMNCARARNQEWDVPLQTHMQY